MSDIKGKRAGPRGPLRFGKRNEELLMPNWVDNPNSDNVYRIPMLQNYQTFNAG
uniref:Uncharacterized protein n=1 Tax=Setaria digitata TaxID=48799 RepID=A0A915PG42_9BILA